MFVAKASIAVFLAAQLIIDTRIADDTHVDRLRMRLGYKAYFPGELLNVPFVRYYGPPCWRHDRLLQR